MSKLKQLQRELSKAEKEHSIAFQHALSLTTDKEFEDYMIPFQEKINSLSRKIRLIEHPKYSDIPSYGDLMTLEKFILYVKDGCFIDYDGHGKYATETQMTNILIYPSDVKNNMIRKDFTYVVWFNR